MRSRMLLVRRAGHLKTSRAFTQSTAARIDYRPRPRVPFLAVSTTHAGLVRYLTTNRVARIKYDIKTGIKYTGYVWIAGIALFASWVAIFQEQLERRYPTPHEWSYKTRLDFRGGNCARYEPPPGKPTDWLQVAGWFEMALNRLHDPNIDGKGVKDAGHEYPPGTKDVTAKSEEWRRGYFQTLMGYAKAVEYMEGWVLDKSRNICFPPGTMIGPSNPFPKPLPPGFKGAPREEDCVPRFDSPNDIYVRILSTPGFTNRQRIEAGLAYASWLEYKGITGPASIVYEDAVRLAATERPDLPAEPIDKKTYVLNDAAGPPSENLLNTLTAYATFRARQGHLDAALPILVSLLKARRNLPTTSPTPLTDSLNNQPSNKKPSTWSKLVTFVSPPPYPPPPPPGTAPPLRNNPLNTCQQAALGLHIGEIMYALASSPSSKSKHPNSGGGKEEALAWTRDAVDVAEEQLRYLPQAAYAALDSPARVTCKECLAAGLDNWRAMVGKLAREEETKRKALEKQQQQGAGAGWLSGLWSKSVPGRSALKEEEVNRWAAEEKVVEERRKRVSELLEDIRPAPSGVMSMFFV